MEDGRSLDLWAALRLPRPSSFSRPLRLPRLLRRPGRSSAASAARLPRETFPGSSEKSCRQHSPDRETAVSDPDGAGGEGLVWRAGRRTRGVERAEGEAGDKGEGRWFRGGGGREGQGLAGSELRSMRDPAHFPIRAPAREASQGSPGPGACAVLLFPALRQPVGVRSCQMYLVG